MNISNYVDQAIEDGRKIDKYFNNNHINPIDVEAMKLINYKIREQPGTSIDEIFNNSENIFDGIIFFDRHHLLFGDIPLDIFKKILHLRTESHQKVHKDPDYRNIIYQKLISEVAPQVGINYNS